MKITTIEQASKLTNEELSQLSTIEKKAIKKNRTLLPGYTNGIITNSEHKRIITAISSKKEKVEKVITGSNSNYTPNKEQQLIDDITPQYADNTKWRYVNTFKWNNNMNNLTPLALLTLKFLEQSRDTNSLGIYQVNLGIVSGETNINDIEVIKECINELQSKGFIRYINGYVILNNFRSQQKKIGNKSNLIGIIKLYNNLPYNVKLPYLAGIDVNSSIEELIEFYQKMVNGIKYMGELTAGNEIEISELNKVWSEEEINNIINKGVSNYEATKEVTRVALLNTPQPIIFEQEVTKDKEEKPQPITFNEEVTKDKEEKPQSIDHIKNIQAVAISDDEIIEIISKATEMSIEELKKYFELPEFNILHRYIITNLNKIDVKKVQDMTINALCTIN